MSSDSQAEQSQEIDAIIDGIGDWRGERLAELRALIKEADPDVVEEIKWRKPSNPAGVPVWSHDGIICTGEAYNGKAKLTFANGAKLDDPTEILNSGNGKTMRALDLYEGDTVDAEAFKALVRTAIEFNAG